MKRIIFILSAIFLSSANAEIFDTSKIQANLSLDMYNEKYTEFDFNSSKIMEEEALMIGMNNKIIYNYSKEESFVIKNRFAFSNGEKYIGAYTNSNYGSLVESGINRNAFEIGMEYDKKIQDINLGVGVNLKKITDRLDKINNGYARVNNLWYVNISLSKEYKINEFNITPKINLKGLINGVQESYISPILKHSQSSGYGYDLEIQIKKKISNYSFTLTPYYRFMEIDDSSITEVDLAGIIYKTWEPKNKTTEIGLNLQIPF